MTQGLDMKQFVLLLQSRIDKLENMMNRQTEIIARIHNEMIVLKSALNHEHEADSAVIVKESDKLETSGNW